MDLDTREPIPSKSTHTLPDLQILPYITVQHDMQAVIQDVLDGTVPSEYFWISVYRQGQPSVHGKVNVRSAHEEGQVVFEALDGIEFERHSSTSYEVGCPSLKIPKTPIRMPRQVKESVLKDGVDAMDVAPNGKLYVVGGRDGKLYVGKTGEGHEPSRPLKLEGHVGDVLSCSFFLSSEVVLSTSSDLSIRIFSALDGSNPRTLTGHSAAVNDSAVIERGKHILTASNDGTVKLWNIGESRCLKTWRVGSSSGKRVTKVIVMDADPNANASETITSPSTTTTTQSQQQSTVSNDLRNKIAIAATESGKLCMLDVHDSAFSPPIREIQVPTNGKAISALACRRDSEGRALVAVGTVEGQVLLYVWSRVKSVEDLKESTPQLLARWRRNQADITSLAFVEPEASSPESSHIRLVAGTSDGLPFQVLVTPDGVATVSAELCGYDIDACNAVLVPAATTSSSSSSNESIYAAGKDGHLRRY